LYGTKPDATAYLPIEKIRYQTIGTKEDRPRKMLPFGGVPLRIHIEEDIFYAGLKPTPVGEQLVADC